MKDKYCLESVVDHHGICNNPANTSSSKHLYSFAKTPRFPHRRPYCDNIYDVAGTMTNQGHSMGYGKKSDFTRDLTVSPPTFVEFNAKYKKGYSMSKGRQNSPFQGHIKMGPMHTPGVGKYEVQKSFDRTIKNYGRYTMRPKYQDTKESSKNKVPGPGAYQNPQTFNKTGKFIWSKFINMGQTNFNPPRSKRFPSIGPNFPGPGSYHVQRNQLSDSGHYMLSTQEGFGKRKFSRSKRNSFVDLHPEGSTPGPGTYRRPSDFGHYDHK